MRRVLSILVVAGLVATNVGAAPVLDHQQPQSKTSTHPKVTSNDKTGRKSASSTTAKAKVPAKPYQVGDASWYGKQFHGKEWI